MKERERIERLERPEKEEKERRALGKWGKNGSKDPSFSVFVIKRTIYNRNESLIEFSPDAHIATLSTINDNGSIYSIDKKNGKKET